MSIVQCSCTNRIEEWKTSWRPAKVKTRTDEKALTLTPWDAILRIFKAIVPKEDKWRKYRKYNILWESNNVWVNL